MKRAIFFAMILAQTTILFAWTKIESSTEELREKLAKTSDNEIELVVSDQNPNLSEVCEATKNKTIRLDLTGCEQLLEIQEKAFFGNSKLTEIKFPSSLKKIGAKAFARSALQSVILPENLEEIGDFAFTRTEIMGEVIIPKSITQIGIGAFSSCKKLKGFSVEESNTKYKSRDSVLFSKEGLKLLQYPAGKAGGYEVPANTIEIGVSAFDSAEELSEVELPENLLIIGSYAFHECTKLKEIEIPQNVTHIGQEVFGGTKIKSIKLPKSLKTLGKKPFERMRELEKIEVASENLGGYYSENGVLYSKDGDIIRYPQKKRDALYVIPSITKTITDYSFSDVEYLEQVEISEGNQVIGKYAFKNARVLKSAKIPESTTEIRVGAFLWTGAKETLPDWYDDKKTSFAPKKQEIDEK